MAVWKKDRIRNGHVRESLKVAPVTKKITEKRLNWYTDMSKRRDEGHVLRRMLDTPVGRKETETQAERLV